MLNKLKAFLTGVNIKQFLILAVISAIISLFVSVIYTGITKGPAMQISVQSLLVGTEYGKEFDLAVGLTNNRNYPLQVKQFNSYCYFGDAQVNSNATNSSTSQNSVGSSVDAPELDTPLLILDPYQSIVLFGKCKTPNKAGEYDIKIEAVTSEGTYSSPSKLIMGAQIK